MVSYIEKPSLEVAPTTFSPCDLELLIVTLTIKLELERVKMY